MKRFIRKQLIMMIIPEHVVQKYPCRKQEEIFLENSSREMYM